MTSIGVKLRASIAAIAEYTLQVQTDVVLLPGLHGSVALFDSFIALAPTWARCRPITLPVNGDQSFEALAIVLEQAVRGMEGFVLFAESFSAPIAAKIAHRLGEKVAMLVLCNPLVEVSAAVAPSLLSRLLRFRTISTWLTATALTGSQLQLAKSVMREIHALPPRVLEQRLAVACAARRSELLPYLAAPLLLITSTSDRLIDADVAESVVREVPFAISRKIRAPHLAAQTAPSEIWAIISEEFVRAA